MSKTLKIQKNILEKEMKHDKIEFEADDVTSSCGNEAHYAYNLLNFINLTKDKDAWSLSNFSETDDFSQIMRDCLHSYSHM